MNYYRKWQQEKEKERQKNTSAAPRNYYEQYKAEKNGAQMTANMQNRLQSWMNEHNSFLKSYAERFGGRDGDYSTLGYVTDAQDWYDSVAEKGSALGETAAKLLEDLRRDSYIYGDEYVQAVSELLTSGRDVYSGITETAKGDVDFWAQFNPTEQQKAAGYDTAEKVYDAWRTDNKYRTKHEGKSRDEINRAILYAEDEVEADWLRQRATELWTSADEQARYDRAEAERQKLYVEGGADYFDEQELRRMNYLLDTTRDSHNEVERLKVQEKYGTLQDNEDFSEVSAKPVDDSDKPKKYDLMDPLEKQRYHYLYHNEGKESADDYYGTLSYAINARQQQKNAEEWTARAVENPGWADAVSVGGSLAGVVGAAEALAQKIGNDLKGDYYKPIDFNTMGMTPTVVSSAIRNERARQWAEGTKGVLDALGIDNEDGVVAFDPEERGVLSKLLNGKSAGDLYQLGMSMIDSRVSSVFGPKVGSLLLAGSAATQKMQDVASSGGSDEQALAMGFTAGLAEWFFEKYEIEGLLGKDKKFLRNVVRQGITEGFGEGATSIANIVADNVIMARNSDINTAAAEYQKQHPEWTQEQCLKEAWLDATIGVAWDAIGGAFTGSLQGGLSSAGQNAVDRIGQWAQERTADVNTPEIATPAAQARNDNAENALSIKEQITGNQDLLNQMDSVATIEIPKSFFQLDIAGKINWVIEKLRPTGYKVERKGFGTINFSSKQLKGAFKYFAKGSVEEAAFEALPFVLENGVEIGQHSDHKNREHGTVTIAAPVTIDGQRGNMAVVVKQTTDNFYKVHRILTPEGSVFEMNANEAEPTLDGGVTESGSLATSISSASNTNISDSVAGVNGENVTALTALAAEKVDLENGADEEASAEGRAILGKETVDVAEIADAGKGKVTVRLTDSRTVDAAELSFPDAGEQELWRVIGKYAEDADSARALLAEYRNGSIDAFTYARGVEEAFLYGKVNLSEKEMDLKSNIANQLSPSQRKEAYTQGRIAGEKKAKKQKTDVAQHDPKRRRKGAVHYGYEGEVMDKSKLKPTQKVGVDFAERLARKKGMTFYFYRSFMQDGVRVYKNAEGKIVPTKKNGWYKPGDGSIHIDLNSGDMGSTVLFTIAHELTHWMKDTNLTRYRELCAIVTEGFLERGQSIERLVQNKMEEYRQAGEKLTWEEAYDEVIASSLEGVLSDGNVIDLLDEAETKSLPLWDQLKSFLEEIAILIHETIQAYRNVEPESPEGRMILRMKELHKQIQETFAAGIHEGGEDFREGGKINTAQEGGVKMQLRNVNGTDVVWIERNLLKENLNNDPTHQFVADYIADHIGDVYTIIESGQQVYIGEDMPGEYTQSKYTQKILKNNPNVVRAKNRAVTGIGEMIEIATGRKWEKTKHTHNKDAKYGMYRYKTRFGFPVKDNSGKTIGANVYSAELLIRNASDGKKYLYDIVSIKKDNASSNWLTNKVASAAGKPTGQKGNVSTSSIRSSDPNVNKNSLRYQKNEAAQSHMAEQNAKLAADMAGLKAFVNLQKKQGRQGKMETAATNAAATFLMKTAGAKGNKADLMNLLDGFYRYVANSTEQSWESIREKAMPIVRWLMQNTVRTKQRSDYAQDVLNTLHGSRVSLDETQKGEVAHIYGSFSAFRNTVMGSVTLANDGISLDSQWQEWAEMYPDLFDADVNAADMPEALSDIVRRLRNDNTSELEYEYSREFIEQELLSRVYDSYWNASTLYSVADHYEGQLKQLKAKHWELMQSVYARHQEAEAQQRDVYRQRQEAAKSHYEERYQRREAEYRESRRQAVERHDKAQVRQQIRKDVKRLDSLLNRGTKEKNVKLELQDFAGAALRTAKGAFLKNYNEYDMVRSGVEELQGREQKAVFARAQALLKELDQIRDQKSLEPAPDNFHEKWDPEADLRRDDREEALKKELAQNMAVLRNAGVFKAENERIEDSIADQLMDELMAAYNALNDSENAHVRGVFSTAIYNQMESVKKFLAGKAIKDMTAIELGELKKMYRMVLHTITTSNDLFAQQRKTDVRKLGEEVIEQLRTAGKEMTPEILDTLAKMGWANLKPETALELIGSDTLTEMMQGLYRGEDTYARDLEHAKQYAQEQGKKYGRDKWDLKESVEFAGTKITLGQAMSLYAYTKRKQAQGHLEGEGFTHSSNVRIKKSKGKVPVALTYIMNATRTHIVPKGMYEQVADLLTPQQRKYVDAMQEYLSKVMGTKGNEVSMQLYGVKLFEETMYFPLKTASEYREEPLGATSGEVKLKNSGFTNTVVEKASNPIVLDSFEDVWAGHVDKMSLYHGFVLPMEDFDRVYNYRHAEEQEISNSFGEVVGSKLVDTNESVKVDIENKVGKAANAYIEDLMKQLNGGVRGDATEKLFSVIGRNFKKTAVLGSLSVAVQQPTAFIRAMAYLDPRDVGNPKDFLGKAGKPEGKILDEMYKYAPVALMKRIGGFDPGLGRKTRDYVFGDKQGIAGALDAFLGKFPEKMDEWTWSFIWVCTKRQIHRQHPDLQINSEAFLQKVGEKFSKIIRDTQVYDSVLTKSQLMRSKNMWLQMATAFMNEPTTSMDMYIRSTIQAKRGKIKKSQAARTYAAVVGSQLLTSAVVSFVYALRDDDEDETYWEKYLSAVVGKAWENTMPWYSIPFVKDLFSAFDGHTVERSDMSLVTDLYQGRQKLMSNKTTPWEKTEAFAGSILNLFGIPLKNVSRDVRGIFNTVKTWITGGVEKTSAGLRYAALEGLTGKKVPKTEQLQNAVAENDAKHILRVLASYSSESSAFTDFRSAVKAAYLQGDVTDAQAVEFLQVYAGEETADAQDKVVEWDFQKQHPDTELKGSKILDYVEFAEPAGISLEIYTEYCKNVAAYSKKDDILKVIHNLPISKKQKDALYYAEGFAESTLDEAPWR